MEKFLVLPLLHSVSDMMSWRDYDRALIISELSHAMAGAAQSCDNQRNMSRRELIISKKYFVENGA